MNFYTEPLSDLLKHFDADQQKGLNEAQLDRRAPSMVKTSCASKRSPRFWCASSPSSRTR